MLSNIIKGTIIALLMAGAFILGNQTHTYSGLNAGVQVANVGGYEWKGEPGFFKCDGQC
jgi:hypothetical protein